jgi:hypothetical protein
MHDNYFDDEITKEETTNDGSEMILSPLPDSEDSNETDRMDALLAIER